jgi:hypothetical protein
MINTGVFATQEQADEIAKLQAHFDAAPSHEKQSLEAFGFQYMIFRLSATYAVAAGLPKLGHTGYCINPATREFMEAQYSGPIIKFC